MIMKNTLNSNKSLQEKYAPKGICFGCGCLNKKGLQVKSFVESNSIAAKWTPSSHHEAFPGVLNGGIIGSLLDCHSNWAAAYYLMKNQNLNSTPCTVTAEYAVKLRKPTPSDISLSILANLSKIDGNKAWIDAELSTNNQIYATCSGLFVAVGENHPAYHRW